MHSRLDVGRIVEKQVEHIMALMLVSADTAGQDGNVVGRQRIIDSQIKIRASALVGYSFKRQDSLSEHR